MTDNPNQRAGLRDYLQLVRLPNLFTSMADVAMGLLFVQAVTGLHDPWMLRMGLLMAASAMLYAGGVVLNDVFDLELDRTERPERPLPSGKISPRLAALMGWELLIVGAALAWAVSYMVGSLRPGIVAVLLAGCIVGYDAILKRTPFGPVAMGACRMLNVLLGMSVLDGQWQTCHWLAAGAIGTYVVGVTWFARTEAVDSKRPVLAAAAGVMMLALGMLAALPNFTPDVVPQIQADPRRWYFVVIALAVLVGMRCFRAIIDPTPGFVQIAVKNCIVSIVIIDAAVCYLVRDVLTATLVFLALLIPAMFAGWFIKST